MNGTKWFRLSIIALSLILVGCITDYTPEARVLELAPGASQIFTATSDDPNAKLVWYLDGEPVADDATQYLFVAGQQQPAGEEALEYHLVVREEGGRYPALAQSVTWDIKIVAPAVCYLDADGDGFGDPDKMVMGDNPPANCVEINTDCDDGNAAVNPYAEEMCTNGIDDDCNGGVDDGCWPILPNVKATDLDNDLAAGDGRFNVTVTWNACPGATYYVVYRSIFHEEGEHANYERVSVDPITTTSFTYVQTYEADLLAHVGPMPTLPLNPTDAQKVQFINALTQYRTERVEPCIYKFKAPSYFKVQACNQNNECSELSQADFGQADFIHRADYSELVPIVIMAWGENLLKILADVPGGPNGANWCGMDICGYDGNGPGGIVMGRLKADAIENMVDWECMYNEFINGADMAPHPDASVAINGLIEGRMDLTEALFHGIYRVGGDFIARLYNRFEVTGTTRIHIGGELNADGQLIPGGRNEGWVAVTYNGVASRYTMPLNPAAVQDPNLNYLQAELPVPTAEINEYGWHSAFSEWTPYYEESGSPFDLCTPENTCESPLIPQPLAPFITGRPPEVQNNCRHPNAAVVGFSQPCYVP